MDRPLPPLALLAAAALVAVGMTAGGWFVGAGFERGRTAPPSVTVKGLAEREVQADLAVWPLRVAATGDDLAAVQAKIDGDVAALASFLVERGIEDEAVLPQRVEVTDLLAQPWRPEGASQNRFIIAQTVIVRTAAVELVERLNRETGELVRQGLVLQETGGPNYLFTRLNDIKPQMIADATANARAAARQFAADAATGIAGIRSASQGLFQILPRDPVAGLTEPNQIDKTVRVVTTIEYRLAD